MSTNKLAIIVFFVFLLTIFGLTIFMPKNQFSEIENRDLSSFPTFSFSRLLDGSYMRDIETYFSDHIVGRTALISGKTRMELLSGKRKSGGVFILENQLIEEQVKGLTSNAFNNVALLNEFAKRSPTPVQLMLVPTACEIYRSNLPKDANLFNQKDLIDNIYANSVGVTTIDCFTSLFAAKNDYIYYRTDEHLTSLGAYYGYDAASKSLGFMPIENYKYNIAHVAHNYLGSLYAKTMYTTCDKDVIDFYAPSSPPVIKSVVTDDGVQVVERKELYARQYLKEYDKYKAFLGSPAKKVTIKTNLNNGKKLLVIKDSYADAMAQFLYLHYEEITFIDLAYLDGSIRNEVTLSHYENILFIYGIVNFMQDKNLVKLSSTPNN